MKTCNTTRRIRQTIIHIGLFVIGIGVLLGQTAVFEQTAVYAQTIITPTPNSDGEILIEVKPNDSLWVIAASVGITLEELLQLNGLNENSVVQPGDLLIVGYGTPEPSPTPIVPTPTPSATLPPPATAPIATPQPTGLCLLAYNDTDGNGEHHPGEPLRADVAFTVYNEQSVILNYITNGISEPACFENMVPGTYRVTRSLEKEERTTTLGNRTIVVQPGMMTQLTFGSTTNPQLTIQSEISAEPQTPIFAPSVGATDGETAVSPNQSRVRLLISLIIAISILLVLLLFFIIMRLSTHTKE